MTCKSNEWKYFPLQNYLKKKTTRRVILTYEEIEKLLSTALPLSAHKYPAWWVNSTTGHPVQAAAWMETDYRVKNVQYGESVEFIRIEDLPLILESVNTSIDYPNSMGSYKEELAYLDKIANKLNIIQSFFRDHDVTEFGNKDITVQFEAVRTFRRMIGNIDNDMSFLGCLLVKEFLEKQHNFEGLNIGLKPQGAAGLDFDEMTVDGKRVIGELKTTYPYLSNDLGANQKGTFLHDFEKLDQNEADMKYFFVTEERAFTIVKLKYSQYLQNVTLVLLPQTMTGGEYAVTY